MLIYLIPNLKNFKDLKEFSAKIRSKVEHYVVLSFFYVLGGRGKSLTVFVLAQIKISSTDQGK